MKNEMSPKQKSNELSLDQKKNLGIILSTLILINRENLDKENLSESILNIKKEFIQILPQFINAEKLEQIEKIQDKKELLKKYVEQISQIEVGWGFTPKLALENEDGIRGLDCTGAAIVLGVICEKHAIPIQIGKQIQHAVIIADFNGEKYYADPRNNKFFRIWVAPKQFKGYDLYQLPENEQIKTASQYRLIATSSLDQFIGDAIFENIQELKNLSLDNENDIPEENQKSGKCLAKKYKQILLMEDWSVIHDKLFPQVNDFKKDNNELWKQEEIRIKSLFEQERLAEVFNEVIFKTSRGLGYTEAELPEIYKKIILELKEKSNEVINFLKSDDISNPLAGIGGNYINELKKHIIPLNNKEKMYIIKIIETKI